MTNSTPTPQKIMIRPFQYRDLEAIASLLDSQSYHIEQANFSTSLEQQLQQVRSWYGLLKFLSWFPNPCQHDFRVYVAEKLGEIQGFIQISPFNSTRSTWRVEQVVVDPTGSEPELISDRNSIGSQLLRHCLETIWEARTWLLEVNVNQKNILALYRQNGFQPLAQMTYWGIEPETLNQIARHEVELPNLLSVSNADAYLLYQLDTVSMPPLLRQVFDRHILDFKISLVNSLINNIRNWLSQTKTISAYVFEPQRKAAIGYFKLNISLDGQKAHQADLKVHPAYTWLYPQILARMAQLVQVYPSQILEIASADYQSEREEYLEKLGANRLEHTLLMSRSVWHKLRETRPLEGLQLSDVLQSLQPSRTPIPSRFSWWKSLDHVPVKNQIEKHLSEPQKRSENE
jgi:ribosomal protein S18 acetylase RimI-like enzyme